MWELDAVFVEWGCVMSRSYNTAVCFDMLYRVLLY